MSAATRSRAPHRGPWHCTACGAELPTGPTTCQQCVRPRGFRPYATIGGDAVLGRTIRLTRLGWETAGYVYRDGRYVKEA
jgi:hypothetical protein